MSKLKREGALGIRRMTLRNSLFWEVVVEVS